MPPKIGATRALSVRVALWVWELLLTLGAVLLAARIRDAVRLDLLRPGYTPQLSLWLPATVAVAWGILLAVFRPRSRQARFRAELARAAAVVAIGTAALLAAAFAVRAFETSRAFLAIFAGIDFALLVASRGAICYLSRYSHKRGYDQVCVLVVGTGSEAREHEERLREAHELHVIGFVSIGADPAVDSVRVLGGSEDLYSILKTRVVDEVHFAVSLEELPRQQAALEICADLGIRSRIAVTFLNGLSSRLHVEHVADRPVLTLSEAHHDDIWLVLKRIFDVVVASTALLLASPFLAIVAAAILVTSGRPIVYRHRRIGKNGRPFTLYKFRTMVVGADRTDNREYDGPFVKVREDDARITRLGRFLRKTSLDELPQLVNVLKGDMSLVGPRPLVEEEVRQLEERQRRRLRMRPGVTGLWQSAGRNELPAEERLKLDTEYVDRWSFLLDAKILLQTVPSVLTRKGAR